MNANQMKSLQAHAHLLHLSSVHACTRALVQVAELVTQVVPASSLAELAALEAILTALAQQGILSVPALVQLLFQDMCHYFMKLQQADQAQRERRRKSRSSAGATTAAAARDGNPSTAMDFDADAGQEADAAGAEEAGLARGEIVEGLRHVFALLSMLASAQPGAIKAKHVPVLLEVAFSPHLAVSDHSRGDRRYPVLSMSFCLSPLPLPS